MTPEREAELRLYCSLEMQDALKEIDRLRASQAAAWKTAREQGEEIGILPAESTSLDALICGICDKYAELFAYEKERAEINWAALERIKEKWATERERVKELEQERKRVYEFNASQCECMEKMHDQLEASEARVKELEEALREARCWIPYGSRQSPEQRGAKCATAFGIMQIIDAVLDRHASLNQDDVAEQSRESREFMGGTK